MRSLALFLVGFVVVVCGPSASGTPTAPSSGSAAGCVTTTPPPAALAPLPSTGTGPNPSLTFRASPGTFLYGNDALVVLLTNDGTLHPSDSMRGLAGGVKFPWWRIAPGDLRVDTRRLDASTAPLPADVPSGYGDTGFQVSGLNFAAAGCWQVSGTIGGKTLTFVVNVAAQ